MGVPARERPQGSGVKLPTESLRSMEGLGLNLSTARKWQQQYTCNLIEFSYLKSFMA